MSPYAACLHGDIDMEIKSHWRWMWKTLWWLTGMVVNSGLRWSHPGEDHICDGGMKKWPWLPWLSHLSRQTRAASAELKSSVRVWNECKHFHTLQVGFCFPASNRSLLWVHCFFAFDSWAWSHTQTFSGKPSSFCLVGIQWKT